MKINQIAYRKIDVDYGYDWKPLKPTGKWKLETTPHNEDIHLWIEHKGWFFKIWVHESNIEFRNEVIKNVFECVKPLMCKYRLIESDRPSKQWRIVGEGIVICNRKKHDIPDIEGTSIQIQTADLDWEYYYRENDE